MDIDIHGGECTAPTVAITGEATGELSTTRNFISLLQLIVLVLFSLHSFLTDKKKSQFLG